jgi:hypothetical protein
MSAFLDQMDADLNGIVGGEFSIPATLSNDAENWSGEVQCLFDLQYSTVDDDGVEILSDNPRLTISGYAIPENIAALLRNEKVDDWKATVNGIEYAFSSINRAGTNVFVIQLLQL